MRKNPLTIRGVLVAAALGLVWSGTLIAGPYPEGEYIEITGTVTDPDGIPVPDVKVVFSATRRSFAISRMQRKTRDEVREIATTDPHGRFSFRWRWLDYYNRFELLVGIPRRAAAGESFNVLLRQDLTKRIGKGSPVVTALVVTDTEFLAGLRDFLATVDSPDEKRIYDEMGNPDRVQTIEHPDYDEVSWWYFGAGRAYRFREGKVEETIEFEPVLPFPK